MPVSISSIWLPSGGSSKFHVETVYVESTKGETWRKYMNTNAVHLYLLDETLSIDGGEYNTTTLTASWVDISVDGYIVCCVLNDSSIVLPHPSSFDIDGIMYQIDYNRYLEFGIGMRNLTSSSFSYYCESSKYEGTKIDIYYL